MIDMGRVLQRPSPNYSPVAINHDLIIVHDMEGGYEGSVAYLCQPKVQASPHLCMNEDGSEWSQLAPLGMKAWAQCFYNGRGVSIEVPGFVAKGIPDVTLLGLAKGVGYLARAYGIPPTWAQGGQGRGVCSHHDLGAAGGGHVDLCGVGDATWTKFLGFVQAAYAEFDPANLPPFALHGLPGPHQIVAPPAVTPEASHGGAPRKEPGDSHAHPTDSKYPVGSMADIQHRLDMAGVADSALVVDGVYGPATKAAILEFQRDHGLTGDGIVGPATWAALSRVAA